MGTNNIAAFFCQACCRELLAGYCYSGVIFGRTSFEFFDKVVGNVLQVVLVGAKFIPEFAELGQQVFGDLGWETWGVWEPLKLHCVVYM